MTTEKNDVKSIEAERFKREIEVHREVSLDLIRSTPSYAVRTPRGQKDPGHFRWDPKGSNEETSAQNLHTLARNDDNIGIHLFGEMVDVDIDTENEWLMLALDHFLPYTPHIWGRVSRPRTHRLYQVSVMGGLFDPSSYKFLNYIASMEQCKMELRGGRKENARYSLLPGSLHPSNEYYTWNEISSARSTPVIVPEEALIKAVRLSCVTALLAPFWTEGVRNSMCLALSGFLYKAVMFSEEVNGTGWSSFSKDDAEELIRGICEISGDDDADIPARIKSMNMTWEKAEGGARVKGATALAEMVGDPDLPRHLYALLTDAKGLVEFEDFAKNFAFWLGEGKIISLKHLDQPGSSPFMNPQAFHDSYAHRRVEMPNSDGPKPMTRMFINSKHVLRVDGFKFQPGMPEVIEEPEREQLWLNRWGGFAIPPSENYDRAQIEPFLDYLFEIVANNDRNSFDWILAWMADIFKYPDNKCGTALVLVGPPGAGKSFLGHGVLGKIIGKSHFAVVNSVAHLVGQFTSETAYKVLIQCDEALNSRQREVANRMKAMITDHLRRVEAKNVNAIFVEDHTRYLFTSNELDEAVAIVDGEADRRYAVYEVSDRFAFINKSLPEEVKTEYWNKMYGWAAKDENLASLHAFLLEHEYDRATIRTPQKTEARTRTQQSSMRGFDDWLFGLVSLENPFDNIEKAKMAWSWKDTKFKTTEMTLEDWPDWVAVTALKVSYDRYRRQKGNSASIPDYNEQQILVQLRERRLIRQSPKTAQKSVIETEYVDGDIIEKKRRLRIYEFPTKLDITKYLSLKYGYTPQTHEEVDLEEAKPENKKVEF